jgi:hypothetical protein
LLHVVDKVVPSTPGEGDGRVVVDSIVSLLYPITMRPVRGSWPCPCHGPLLTMAAMPRCLVIKYPLCERASDSGLLELLFLKNEGLSVRR